MSSAGGIAAPSKQRLFKESSTSPLVFSSTASRSPPQRANNLATTSPYTASEPDGISRQQSPLDKLKALMDLSNSNNRTTTSSNKINYNIKYFSNSNNICSTTTSNSIKQIDTSNLNSPRTFNNNNTSPTALRSHSPTDFNQITQLNSKVTRVKVQVPLSGPRLVRSRDAAQSRYKITAPQTIAHPPPPPRAIPSHTSDGKSNNTAFFEINNQSPESKSEAKLNKRVPFAQPTLQREIASLEKMKKKITQADTQLEAMLLSSASARNDSYLRFQSYLKTKAPKNGVIDPNNQQTNDPKNSSPFFNKKTEKYFFGSNQELYHITEDQLSSDATTQQQIFRRTTNPNDIIYKIDSKQQNYINDSKLKYRNLPGNGFSFPNTTKNPHQNTEGSQKQQYFLNRPLKNAGKQNELPTNNWVVLLPTEDPKLASPTTCKTEFSPEVRQSDQPKLRGRNQQFQPHLSNKQRNNNNTQQSPTATNNLVVTEAKENIIRCSTSPVLRIPTVATHTATAALTVVNQQQKQWQNRPNTTQDQNPGYVQGGRSFLPSDATFVRTNMDRLELGDVLGEGSYAVVRKARDIIANRTVAIKIYDKFRLINPQKRNNVKREMFILKKLSHQNIIQLFFTVDTQFSINLVMEYIGSLSLWKFVKSKHSRCVTEQEARQIFRQIVDAVSYCHSLDIVHRDLKLENILINEDTNEIKLIDFGFATKTNNEEKLTMFCGTASYMSPELVQRQEYLGKPCDIWALGILLFVLVEGRFPFKGKSDPELFENITRNEGISFSKSGVKLKLFLLSILKSNPLERPTSKEMLNSDWILGQ